MHRRLLLFGVPSAITLAGMMYVEFVPQDPPPATGYVVIREGGESAAVCQQKATDGPHTCLTEISVPLPLTPLASDSSISAPREEVLHVPRRE